MLPINPLLSLPQQDLLLLDCLKRGDLDSLKALTRSDWIELTLCPYYFAWIYSPYEKLRAFNQLFKSMAIFERKDQYREQIQAVIHGLSAACDIPGDLGYIEQYLAAQYDFHRYGDGTYVRYAINSYRYDIAMMLMQDDAALAKWPYILHEQIFWEHNYFMDETGEFNNPDFRLGTERIRFMIEHGCPVNTIMAYCQSSTLTERTPLDVAIFYYHPPAIELLKEYGGKSISELPDQKPYATFGG